MSALHKAWLAEQAEQPTLHENGVWLRPAETRVSDTTRRHARTLDEAFRTPAWRNPVQGPYRRGSRLRAHLARHALRWALLLLGAALLIEGLA